MSRWATTLSKPTPLLIATGTVSYTDELGLENTGIQTDAQGNIQVDGHLHTAVDGVYALGDCVGNYLFRHTVNYEGEYLVRNCIGKRPGCPYRLWSGTACHLQPSRSRGRGTHRRASPDTRFGLCRGTRPLCRQQCGGWLAVTTTVLPKLLIERSSRRILGAHILGPEASDMIHLFIMAMKTGATLDTLLDTIFIHPALPEIARDAARDAVMAL